MTKHVLMSDELFEQLGASKVDWGEPDKDGFYTPSVYRDYRLETALRELHHPMMELDYISIPSRYVEVCAECEIGDGFHRNWPCATASLFLEQA